MLEAENAPKRTPACSNTEQDGVRVGKARGLYKGPFIDLGEERD